MFIETRKQKYGNMLSSSFDQQHHAFPPENHGFITDFHLPDRAIYICCGKRPQKISMNFSRQNFFVWILAK